MFERALTEEPNRRSIPLWERYVTLEFDLGDLQSALRLEKRAREALGLDGGGAGGGAAGGGAAAGAAGGAKGLQLQLLLLRYEYFGVLPVAPNQRQYIQHLVGKGPPPPGFEKGAAKRGAGGSDAGGVGEGAAGGGAGAQGAGAGVAVPAPRVGTTPVGGLFSGTLPWVVEEFLNRLPPPQYLDGPMPDVSVLVDAFMNTDFDSPAVRQALLIDPEAAAGAVGPGRGVKRDMEEEEGYGAGGARDMYRMRIKQRTRVASGADG